MSTIDGTKIKLFQLRAFLAVVEQGSFGKAALELGLTQSAISHAIASLETELGVALLFRGRQGASLTPVGTELVPHVAEMLRHLEQIVAKAQVAKGLDTGQVRIAAIRSLATYWVPPAIAAFKQRYPQITVTVTRCTNHGAVQAALRSGEVDIGLMDIDQPRGLIIYNIGSDDYNAFFPPNAKLPDQEPLTWEILSQYPLILPVPDDNSYAPLRRYLQHLPIPMSVAYEVNEDSAIVSMVAEGLGMTILPQLAAIPVPPTVQVRSLPQPLKRHLGAVILEDGLHSPPVYAFLDTIDQVKLDLL